jgi:DNA-binding MarR family transcriptional regulator
MVHPQIELVEASLGRLSSRMPDAPVTEIFLTRLLVMLGADLTAMLEQHVRPFGLGEGEFRVLSTLFSQPNGVANPSELCARASKTPANMSRICDALVSRDLITRGPSSADRRKMVLRISDKGEELVQALMPTVFASLRRLFDGIAASDQAAMAEQFKHLVQRLDSQRIEETTDPMVGEAAT